MGHHATQVEIRDLRKTYVQMGMATPALRGLTTSFAGGSLTAVVGPSGCGKSTMLGVLAGLDHADSGTVRVGGFDLTAARSDDLTAYRRRSVGVVFQSYNLLPSLTAAENVEAGLEFLPLTIDAKQRRARDVLAWLGLADLGRRFPAQLSGGQQQRVAIARAVAREPALVLADEPTGNLDREAAHQVMDVLRRLTRELGATCVLVTHDLELAARADRTVRLSDGVALGDGDESGVRQLPRARHDSIGRVPLRHVAGAR